MAQDHTRRVEVEPDRRGRAGPVGLAPGDGLVTSITDKRVIVGAEIPRIFSAPHAPARTFETIEPVRRGIPLRSG